MIADAIRLTLTNLPGLLFVAALAIAAIRRDGLPAARYLKWILLLSVGVEMLWAGFFHVFFPAMAAERIGWQVSPFQFEVGVADMAAGAIAVIAFWKGYQFRAAIALYVVFFYIGVTIGHLRDVVEAGNYAPDNFGLLLLLTVTKIVLLSVLVWRAGHEARGGALP